MKQHVLSAILCVAAFLCVPPRLATAQTQSNPFRIPCAGWSNGWAYPGSSDCMWNNNDDKEFTRKVTLGEMADVELGRLAEQKASSNAVRQFARQIVNDQRRSGDQLKEVAESSSIATPESLDLKHKTEIDRLLKLSGPAFDRAYVKDQLKDSERDFGEFRDEADSGMDANVKNFASKELPIVQQHLKAAEALNRNGEL